MAGETRALMLTLCPYWVAASVLRVFRTGLRCGHSEGIQAALWDEPFAGVTVYLECSLEPPSVEHSVEGLPAEVTLEPLR